MGDVASVGYPQCAFPQYCTATQPRTVTSTYTNGWLTGVTGYASPITYHPNGQVNQVTRANGVLETYYKDPYNQARPYQIEAKLGTTKKGTTIMRRSMVGRWLVFLFVGLVTGEAAFLAVFSAVSVAYDVPPEDILLGAGILALFWLPPIQLAVLLCWGVINKSSKLAMLEAGLIGICTGIIVAALAILTKIL